MALWHYEYDTTTTLHHYDNFSKLFLFSYLHIVSYYPKIMGKLTIIILLMLPTILFVTPLISADFPLAKPNCTDKCGNISIPYPFGTTRDCYQHPSFFVSCRNQTSSDPHKLFMQNTSIEITNISLDGQLKLLQYISRDCYFQNGTRNTSNSPFIRLPLYMTVNKTANKFTILGCDAYGFITGRRQNRSYETGCTAMCDARDDLEPGSCTGVGCCQTSIPKDVWEVNLTMRSYNNNRNVWGFNDCNYAFLVAESAFAFSPENFTNLRNVEKLPMVADWAVGNGACEDARTNSSSYACKGLHSECYKPINGYGYRCRCTVGYQGNPYLDEGCTQDINECIDSKLNNCTENEYCINTAGGFHCKCRNGYKKQGPGQGGCIHGESLAYKLAAGLALGAIVMLLVICLIYLELRRRSSNKDKKRNFLQNGGTLLQQKLKQIERNTARLIYSLTELRKATNNFHDSMIIGQGGFGTVYKGIIENKIVAIKQSKEVSSNQVDQFVNEIVVLSQINHKNVVKLLGCCLEGQVPLLVYEFISNGTLYEHLHCKQPKTTNDDILNWDRRLNIALETAGVLSYLHTDAFTTIIHRDVKSSNILLDNNFTAKVSDFGASKLVPLDQPHLSISVQGTFGYLDPEYMETGQLTEKSDVYSFGAVLVELLTGMRVVRPDEENNFVMFFLSKLRGKRLFDVLDDGIVSEENKEQLIQVANLAQVCLNMKGKDRPTMKEVAMELGGLKRDRKHHENEHNYKLQEMDLYCLDDELNSNDDYELFQFINLTIIILLMLICFSPTFSSTPLIPADFPLAKPNCTDKCGNISIPYPFGTTQDCNYQHPNFWVTCGNQTSSDPPKLFMQNTSIEITNISLDGQLKLLQYISRDCYFQNGTRNTSNNPFIQLPFYITVNNTANKFTILGCDTYGFISGRRQNRNSYETGCTATCDARGDLEPGSCTGLGCCQTSIPKDVWEVNLTMKSYNNNINVWDFNDCNYAFFVEESAFTFSPENFTNLRNVEKLPMVADWALGNGTCEDARTNSSSYACKGLHSECYKPINGYGYRCRCTVGYQGNPYLDEGCTQDINECIDSKLHNCTGNEYCANIVGGFHCKCRKGYKKQGPGPGGCVHGESLAYRLAAGLALGAIVILLVICLIYLELKRRSSNKDEKRNFLQNGGTLLQQKLKQIERNTARLIYSLTELRKATNNFHDSMIIGQGGFGTVYKGIIENKIVAIKQSKEVSSNQVDQFVNEIVVLSQINHKNVVKLIGCCLEGQVPLLVYEFISDGTLYEHLHCKQPKTTNDDFLNWDRRLSIAVETAGVLSYLHTDAFTTIIHRDVKSSNILLDNNFTAKVSDFGASKLVHLDQTHLTISVQGTFGYLDPEYMETGQLTEKSDVYSFGAVLVELLTGMRVVSHNRPEEEKNFVVFFISKLRGKRLFDVLDDGIVSEENKEQLIQVANLAKVCLNMKGKDRPTMKEVAMELGGLQRDRKHHENEHNYKSQEMDLYCLDDGLNSNDDYGNSTSTGYDTSRGHIILPMNDAR
ncbi:hypothetical protein ACJIZ3_003044 [Penstemon smallii]|uniref:Uncharacterized protein n=1 Tax=Penstemon smallii TaxID=265156 RepID=A0ABD3UA31_9LAMI